MTPERLPDMSNDNNTTLNAIVNALENKYQDETDGSKAGVRSSIASAMMTPNSDTGVSPLETFVSAVEASYGSLTGSYSRFREALEVSLRLGFKEAPAFKRAASSRGSAAAANARAAKAEAQIAKLKALLAEQGLDDIDLD